MERSHSLPPLGANPFWSDRLKAEVALRLSRPEDLPVPQDDGDGDWEAETELVPEKGTGGFGKGRGVASGSGGSGWMYVTPPSARWTEGRGHVMERCSEGMMPPDSDGIGENRVKSTKVKGRSSMKSMGPVPPTGEPHPCPQQAHERNDSLQRAMEAEMVQFLRDQNELLLEEVEKLKQQVHRSGQAPSTAPSSWEQVEEHGPKKEDQSSGTAGCETAGHHKGIRQGETPQTPRGRSPTTRRTTNGVRYTPNGTQLPPGSPPQDLPELPPPPFPPCALADSNMFQGYDFVEFRRRLGDAQWVPASMREGKAFIPHDGRDPAARMERELAALKESVARMQGSKGHGGLSSIPNGPPLDLFYGHDLRGVACGPQGDGHGLGHGVRGQAEVCQHGPDKVFPPGGNPVSGHGPIDVKLGPESAMRGGDAPYGRWRSEMPLSPTPAPLPWSEGAGGENKELVELAADASPLELGDWLAVCGPVLRDISSVSSRWWNLTTREAQCYYERWKTSSPLERVQIVPKLPDELLDQCYQRTEQRGVNLLLKAIPADQQQALITARELTSTALLFRLLVRYQPGGSGEKSILLAKLTSLDKSSGTPELAAALRSWRRHYARAQEIGAILPDGTLLLKALEPAVAQIGALDAQAAFRLAQSRLQLGIDQQPLHDGVWRFSQCLLAEAETLCLMASTPSTTTPSPVKVKQMDAHGKPPNATGSSVDKGKGTSLASTPCKYFRSESGCKAGRNCKWSHSWDGIEDKAARCWICGGKDHRKTDCKLKAQGQGKPGPSKDGKSHGEPGGSGGGKSSSKMSTSPSTSSNVAGAGSSIAPKLQEMEGPMEAASEVPAPSDGSKGETGTTSSEALLQEATKLLKSLRAPQLKMIKISQLDVATEGMMVLLDSGATHALRPALTEGEWAAAQPTQVTLADGVTTKLRLKVNSKILVSDPADDTMSQSWIIPLGGITELGYRFEWKGAKCSLRDEQGQELDVCIQHGCPMVTRQLGQEMIARLEHQQVRLVRKALLLKSMLVDPSAESLEAVKNSTEMALTLKMKMMFPDLPDEVLMKVIPDLSSLKGNEGHRIPWNRHKRRRLQQAKSIVIHLFSGPDHRFWEKKLAGSGTEVLCVDLSGYVPADLHDDAVFRFLLSLAASGRVKALLAGPPCRTVSALRFQDDGGPGVLRTEEYPYGVPTLTATEQNLVTGDSVLWFRMLALYMLCEDVRLPDEPQTALAIEQPEDPARYRPTEEVKVKKFMSVWRTKEWQSFEAHFKVRMIHFDQGPMGHIKKKPTSMAVVLRDIHALDGVRGPPSGDPPDPQGQDRANMTLKERCEDSKGWAAWAPGLKVALVLAVQDHLNRRVTPSLEAALRPVGQVALESWRQHYLNDHMPARRDCRDCVRSSARSKPHRKITHPEAYTLSIDLSGKMVIGQDQNRHDCRYMMIAVYTFPVDRSGRSLVEFAEASSHQEDPPSIDADEYTPTEPGGDDPGEDLLREEEPGDVEDPGEAGQSAAEAAGVKHGRAAMEAWQKRIEEAQDVAVRNVTFVEVLPGRAVNNILAALARIYARIRSLGLPLYRIHCDRARELISAPVRRWTLDRGIVTTLTSGDSFKANGRVEGELGVIKKHVRTVVATTGLGLEYWPLAAIHIGERRLRGQLRSLGVPVGPMLQFGSKAFALKKSWQDRYQPWREIRDEVTVLGPAIHSSLTSTSYYVQSVETKRFFYTDDVVVPMAHQPEAAEVCAYLPELDRLPGAPQWEGSVPKRRLWDKTAIPQLSMLYMEGETSARVQNWLCDHRDLFDVHAPNDPELFRQEISSDSWTIETPERTSSDHERTPSDGSSQGAKASLEEESLGGGEWEEAPNNQAGGSYLVASLQCQAPGRAPITRVQFIRSMQANLADYVVDELKHVDITNPDQGCCLEALANAIIQKVDAEENLLQHQNDSEALHQQELEEEFLVTRTISTKEVMDDFENWIPPITAEYDQLVRNKEAVEQITKLNLQKRAEKEGKVIELLPAKMVYTRKSGAGNRRARAVVCGNYSESRFNADCYAGGADGCQVRAVIRTAALKGWSVAATDIRVAFLNAPRREDGKLVAMEIPSVYKRLGLAAEGEVWLVRLAMYGLTTSPKDWSRHRDQTMPSMSWVRMRNDRKVRGHFHKTTDENLWRLEEVDLETGERHWTGLMSVYVDDILMTGEEAALSAGLTSLQATWTTSSVEWASAQTPVHFCGFEITADGAGDGFHLSQRQYEQEILTRWNVNEAVQFPRFKISEEDYEVQVECDRRQVREAQALAGSLLWLSTRSRPDLAYGVAALSRLMTKNPKRAIEIGHNLLAYVKGNPGDMHYPKEIHQKWGARSQLKVQRHDKLIEVFADIAYGAGSNHRSIQGLVVYVAGAPVAWQSSTQPFVTHSTAESELVSYCEALTAGRSIEALMCAIWGEDLISSNPFERVIYGDNVAASGLAYGNSSSSWRTRHLRVRASILREALEDQVEFPGGKWRLNHLKGTELVADGMTKPLSGQSSFGFVSDLGLQNEPVQVRRMAMGDRHLQVQDRTVALQMLVVGGAIIQATQAANATGSEEAHDPDLPLDAVWMCGLILVLIGAIWVGKTALSSIGCCLKRLHGVIGLPQPLRMEEEEEEESEKEGPTMRQSASEEEEGATSRTSSTSEPTWRQSGSHSRHRASAHRLRSGSNDPRTVAAGEAAGAAADAAKRAYRAAEAANCAAASAEKAALIIQQLKEGPSEAASSDATWSRTASRPVQPQGPQPSNPWNKFQRENAGKNWGTEKMRAEYFKAKSTHKVP